MGLLDKWSKKDEAKPVEKTKAPVKAEKKSSEKTETKKSSASIKGSAHIVILKPLVSEKATMAEVNAQYTFLVNTKTNKTEIKKAVKQIYGVLPTSVRVANFEGKRTRSGNLHGKRSDFKKAIVTLPKGHSINIHEGV
ncbi:MAG: 50S ribosomal protein L23 [Patescibacteria group bacterium]|nr:50S ribosomal protein L23 [Patescibacteria group bacterium]